jgi:hypothetical protein
VANPDDINLPRGSSRSVITDKSILSGNGQLSPGYELEYNALRSEILKRIEFNYQIMTFILIVAGTFLSIGTQTGMSSVVLLIYPILAFFLYVQSAYHLDVIIQVGRYIRQNIECSVPGLHWETYLFETKKSHALSPLGNIPAGAIVLVTQVLAVCLAVPKFDSTLIENIMLVVSVVSIIATIVLVWFIETRMKR